jgi:hypothetical protein
LAIRLGQILLQLISHHIQANFYPFCDFFLSYFILIPQSNTDFFVALSIRAKDISNGPNRR